MKMRVSFNRVKVKEKTKIWWVITAVVIMAMMQQVMSLNGDHVCMVKQKYNITKRVKYRAPMSVRTYVWCLSLPPRCSRWTTEMRDLTRLETEERTAEVAVCCPGYKMKDITCVPICPLGKTGSQCTLDCPRDKWGPNCVNDCKKCSEWGKCSPVTGECICQDEWQGERCEIHMSTSTSTTTIKEGLLTTTKPSAKISILTTETLPSSFTELLNTTTQAPYTKNLPYNYFNQSTSIPSTSRKNVLTPTVSESFSASPNSSHTNIYNRSTTTLWSTTQSFQDIRLVPKIIKAQSNREETVSLPNSTVFTTDLTTTKRTTTLQSKTNKTYITSAASKLPTTFQQMEITNVKELSTKPETTRKLETTVKPAVATTKFKPKEIWIKPAQKGEALFPETKLKLYELPQSKLKNTTNKDPPSTVTTSRTIIVSIIPTSMSYPAFKKISLTTASSLHKQHLDPSAHPKDNQHDESRTILNMTSSLTALPFTIKILNGSTSRKRNSSSTVNPMLLENVTDNIAPHNSKATKMFTKTTKSLSNITNSMSSMTNEVTKLNYPSQHLLLTTTPVLSTKTPHKKSIQLTEMTTLTKTILTTLFTTKIPRTPSLATSTIKNATTTALPLVAKQYVTIGQSRNITESNMKDISPVHHFVKKSNNSAIKETFNNSSTETKLTTELFVSTKGLNFAHSTNTASTADSTSNEDEHFHILTEPEHITAVAGERPSDRTSVDLITVITIAGGIMMTIISVAVIIVMIDRYKRRSYEDVRKINNVRMKVMMENDDQPPPYVRSIFHTPLPDPPNIDKCHYQPISTLDRNLKQFMRPVVVHNISPLMIENFRGILECHYDHLPRRSHDFKQVPQMRSSLAPSMDVCTEPLHFPGHSVFDISIDALKCEAKLDMIDSTTSEPLYAEIPSWRPPSEHAVEIINLNGEAVTEL